jgi:hypothetical protein
VSHGFVDLYVNKLGFAITFEQLEQLVAAEGPNDFTAAMDTAKVPNVVLRYPCTAVNPGAERPTGAREAHVVDALDACVRVAEWLAQRSQRLGS